MQIIRLSCLMWGCIPGNAFKLVLRGPIDCLTNHADTLLAASGGSAPCGGPLYPGPRPLDEDHPLMLSQQEDLQVRPHAWQACMAAACCCLLGLHLQDSPCGVGGAHTLCLHTMHPLLLLQALGSVFQELIFSALSTAGPSETTSGAALQRLLTDVFQGRIHEFK